MLRAAGWVRPESIELVCSFVNGLQIGSEEKKRGDHPVRLCLNNSLMLSNLRLADF